MELAKNALPKTGGTVTGGVKIASQDEALSIMTSPGRRNYLSYYDSETNRIGYIGFGSDVNVDVLTLRNDRSDTHLNIDSKIRFNNIELGYKNTANPQTGWWKCGDTGLIRQCFLVNKSSGYLPEAFDFPIRFSQRVIGVSLSMSATPSSYGGVMWNSVSLSSIKISNVSAETQASRVYIAVEGY
ncbi:hypothetical protein [Xenorhabdus entomophaga]|uniref:hypothetical protein n=1 Tax=Xenorhabdus entomophaga TaxID=3136257 RepID=UPI0030F3E1BA